MRFKVQFGVYATILHKLSLTYSTHNAHGAHLAFFACNAREE